MICKHKNIKNQLTEPKLGYIAWFDWADKQVETGNDQELCNDCNRYVWITTISVTKKSIQPTLLTN